MIILCVCHTNQEQPKQYSPNFFSDGAIGENDFTTHPFLNGHEYLICLETGSFHHDHECNEFHSTSVQGKAIAMMQAFVVSLLIQ